MHSYGAMNGVMNQAVSVCSNLSWLYSSVMKASPSACKQNQFNPAVDVLFIDRHGVEILFDGYFHGWGYRQSGPLQ